MVRTPALTVEDVVATGQLIPRGIPKKYLDDIFAFICILKRKSDEIDDEERPRQRLQTYPYLSI